MDSISSMVFEFAAGQGQASGMVAPAQNNVTVFDVSNFEQSMMRAQKASTPAAIQSSASIESTGFSSAISALKDLNGSMETLGTDALRMAADNGSFTPSEMLLLAVKSHELVFQSQMTATVANKTSDGITQLFKQQS